MYSSFLTRTPVIGSFSSHAMMSPCRPFLQVVQCLISSIGNTLPYRLMYIVRPKNQNKPKCEHLTFPMKLMSFKLTTVCFPTANVTSLKLAVNIISPLRQRARDLHRIDNVRQNEFYWFICHPGSS